MKRGSAGIWFIIVSLVFCSVSGLTITGFVGDSMTEGEHSIMNVVGNVNQTLSETQREYTNLALSSTKISGDLRKYLDDLLIDIHPKNYELINDLEKVLRQRNTLLKQAKGVLSSEISNTLSVWDTKLIQLGEMLAFSRQELIKNLDKSFPEIISALQGKTNETKLQYVSSWQADGLEKALKKSREDDLRRGVTTIGPHRDDLLLNLNNMPARTHASQGEQRSLALSLRLAGHKVIKETLNSDPVILLDDVFSELDEQRAKKLIEILPDCQTLITSAGELPHGIQPPSVIKISNGEALAHD